VLERIVSDENEKLMLAATSTRTENVMEDAGCWINQGGSG
jgi:hypothetical protein